MKILSGIVLGSLLAVSLGAVADTSADPAIGTWKLNVAKSKARAGTLPQSETRTYTAADGGLTLSYKRTGADGKESTVKSTYKYDGKDYPISGTSDYDSINVKRIDAHNTESTQKRMGKAVGTTKRTISKDGKTLTLVSKGTNTKGEEFDTTLVYYRQLRAHASQSCMV